MNMHALFDGSDHTMIPATATEQIVSVMLDADRPLALHEIQAGIRKRFRTMHETTAISARMRNQVRLALSAMGKRIESHTRKGCRKWEYRAVDK